MLITSLSEFSKIYNFSLNKDFINQIELVFRDTENFESYNNLTNSLRFEELKLHHEIISDFFQSHKHKTKIIFVMNGGLTIQGTSKLTSKKLDYEFQNTEFIYYRSNEFFEINYLKKGSIIVFDSYDIYRLNAKKNFCKLLIVNID